MNSSALCVPSHLENTLAEYLFEDSDSYMYILMPIKQDGSLELSDNLS